MLAIHNCLKECIGCKSVPVRVPADNELCKYCTNTISKKKSHETADIEAIYMFANSFKKA